MKILFITPIYSPAVGGAAQYFSILMSELSGDPNVNRVLVLTQWVPGTRLIENGDYGLVLRLLLPRQTLAHAWAPYYLVSMFVNLGLTVMLVTILRVSGVANICHFHSSLVFVRRFRNAPLIMAIRVLRYRMICDVRDVVSVPDHRFFGHRVIAASRAIKEKIQTNGLDTTVSDIPVPIRPKLQSPVAESRFNDLNIGSDYVLYVGTVAESKGVDSLFRAWEHDPEFQMSSKLILVGPNYNFPSKLLRHYEQNSNFQYLGALDPGMIEELMDHAAVVVVPSHSEGLPRVCLEAARAQVPFLCSESIDEISDFDKTLTFSSTAPADLSESIKKAISFQRMSEFPIEQYLSKSVRRNYLPVYAN